MKQDNNKRFKSCFSLLLNYSYSYKSLILGFICALIISSASVLTLGKALTYLIDNGLIYQKSLNLALIFLFSVVIALALSTSLRFYFVTLLSEKIILKIREDVFCNLIHQTQIFFSKNKIGSLISSVTNDLSLIQNFIATNLSILLRNFVLLIGSIIILISTNINLFFYIILLIPIVVIPLLFFVKKLKKQSKETQNVIAEMTSHMHEHLQAIKTIQAFSSEKYSEDIFKSQQNNVLLASKKRIFTRSLLTLIVIFVVMTTILILVKKAGTLLIIGKITAGELSAFVFYTIVIAGAFGAITEVIGNLFKSLGAFERIYDILNDDDRNLATNTSKKILDPFPVKLVNVSFSYPNKTDQKTLDNINLTIEKHKITAIVGPSGAGKSSIFNILLKFFDISEGKISIGASNYSQLSKQDIRKHFSLVPQDPFMFSGSICENIALSQNYDEEKIIQALKAAQAYDFVEKLPQTIHTEIGENAAKISSGQKQRIAIARSVYHKSSIILLDEATSNIDNKNEKSFITSLESLKKDHAIVIISHKRETIENSDYVYVIDNGTIVEEGDETKLLNKKGLYKSLLGMQSS